ncbi:unnamed protein product [Schistosoma guineensis]|uniref:Tetraspanin n=3 Tax=Schistosoma TaxID=6181 RepID=A0A095A391_SCHHA|nr:unnamed protein product [Schistosoma mattheei]CAH8548187.1 unnamed protein product [Schistosoma intercalatum]CAH8548429.1 unnamed protein product [Schistosoma intercalatum]CAH8558230.1 unnamed protein product [Schistosoma guineensis]
MCKSCAGCVRVLMIVFNILFTIIGMIVLSAALYFYFSTFGVRGTDQHNILAYTYIVLAAIGALSFVLGILGCCGSYHYSRCLLGFYFALLLVIFAIEIAIGVAGFVHREQARAIIHETLKEGVEDWKNSNNEVRWMDAIHVMFQCCGYNGPTDYGIAKVPSCCLNDQCAMDFALLSFQTGCKERIDNIMHNFLIICISVITIALIELIGLIFAMTLCCAVNGRDPNAYYRAVQTA